MAQISAKDAITRTIGEASDTAPTEHRNISLDPHSAEIIRLLAQIEKNTRA